MCHFAPRLVDCYYEIAEILQAVKLTSNHTRHWTNETGLLEPIHVQYKCVCHNSIVFIHMIILAHSQSLRTFCTGIYTLYCK